MVCLNLRHSHHSYTWYVCCALVGGDFYLVANDFPGYLDAQDKVDATYKDQDKWTRMSIMSVAGME